MKYALIAEINSIYQDRIAEKFVDHISEEIVALFDKKEDAKKYINDSKLKKPIILSFTSKKLFKKNSLLWNASGARVEEYGNPEYPINPTL